MLGTCPTLAISTSMTNSIDMGISAMIVLVCSNIAISMLRRVIPSKVRIPAYIVVIASFVTIVQMLVKAFVPALDSALGVYLPLIVVNCIILGRAEAFAGKNSVAASAVDGIGMGIGFTAALLCMATIREFFGNGTLFSGADSLLNLFGITSFTGIEIFSRLPESLHIEPILILILAPGGFFTFGLLMAVSNKIAEGGKAESGASRLRLLPDVRLLLAYSKGRSWRLRRKTAGSGNGKYDGRRRVMTKYYISILLTAILTNNFVLSKFLGICPFLGVSKKLKTATGMSLAVIFVMAMSTAVTYPINAYLLEPKGLGYLQTIVFILVIAVLVQFVETVLKKYIPSLYSALGIYLPLITTNCAVLGVVLLNVERAGAEPSFGFAASMFNSVGGGLGFMLAMVMFAGVRSKMESCDIPKFLQGLPITLIAASLVSVSFLGFGGIVENIFG